MSPVCNQPLVWSTGFARRGGRHVDGFLTDANLKAEKDGVVWGDNTYLCMSDLGTDFFPGPFSLEGVDHNSAPEVLEAFDTQGAAQTPLRFPDFTIVKLTSYDVHAVHGNDTGKYIDRAFLKVTFSERLFNREGNTVNPNLSTNLVYVERAAGRNTQNFIGKARPGFLEADPRHVDFSNRVVRDVPWVDDGAMVLSVKKVQPVLARRAIPGTRLKTKVIGYASVGLLTSVFGTGGWI